MLSNLPPPPRPELPPSGSAVAAAQAANEAGHYSECATSLLGAAAVGSNNTLLLARCASFSGRLYAAFEAAQPEVTANSRNMEALYWQAEAARKLAQSAFRRAV